MWDRSQWQHTVALTKYQLLVWLASASENMLHFWRSHALVTPTSSYLLHICSCFYYRSSSCVWEDRTGRQFLWPGLSDKNCRLLTSASVKIHAFEVCALYEPQTPEFKSPFSHEVDCMSWVKSLLALTQPTVVRINGLFQHFPNCRSWSTGDHHPVCDGAWSSALCCATKHYKWPLEATSGSQHSHSICLHRPQNALKNHLEATSNMCLQLLVTSALLLISKK